MWILWLFSFFSRLGLCFGFYVLFGNELSDTKVLFFVNYYLSLHISIVIVDLI